MSRTITPATILVLVYFGLALLAAQDIEPAPVQRELLDTHLFFPPREDDGDVWMPDRAATILTGYVWELMASWPEAPKELRGPDLGQIAYDIAQAALARGSDRPSDDAALLAALGYWEGARWAAYVDDGSCNDVLWRASPEGKRFMHMGGDCDGGRAHTFWQIHPIEDLSSSLRSWCSPEAVARSRSDAARCALEIAARSMDGYGSLAGYTGENPYGFHPAANKRLEFAREAVRKHPWTPTTSP